jgi:hypothetical protein
MSEQTPTDLTRRQVLAAGSTFAGYALAADTVLAQAIRTDTDGLIAAELPVIVVPGGARR